MPQERILNQDIVQAFIRNDEYVSNLLFDKNTNSFYLYNGRYHKFLNDDDMIKLVNAFILANFPSVNISPKIVNDIVTMIGWQCYVQVDEIDSPYIALNDKLLNTETFELEEFDLRKIATNLISVDSDFLNETPCPKWEKFLADTLVTTELETDPQLILFVQEMFGYYLTNTLKAHASFFLVGEGRNGKSVLLSVMASMIGAENITSQSIESLTTKQFASYNLIGKKVNICNEEESRYLRPDKFKSLVSGDPMMVERKYKQPFRFTPKCKHIFATNLIPTFEGLNKGLLDRIFIIPFYRYFKPEERNPNLTKELLEELPGILKWSIQGGKRLIANNFRISKPQAVEDMSKEFMETISSAVRYFNEEWEVSDITWTDKKEVYKSYLQWCQDNGRKEMNSHNFFKDLNSNIPGLGRERNLRIDDKQTRCINISRLKEDSIPVDFELIDDGLNINNLKF